MKWLYNILDYFKKREIKKNKVKPSIAHKDIEIRQMSDPFIVAMGELGVKEFKGAKENPRIIEYHSTVHLAAKSDEISWCSSFVNWCFRECGIKDRTFSAAAISWRKWGIETKEPKVGDICIFRRKNSTWQGHVGFYTKETKDKILVLGGNQGNEVSYQWYPKNGRLIYFYQYRTSK